MEKRVMLATHRPSQLVDKLDYPTTVVGQTANVTMRVANSLGANGMAVARGCLAHVEDDFQHINRLFGVSMPKVNMILSPLSFNHDGTGGAYHYGCAAVDLYCDVHLNPNNTWTSLALFVAEAVEVASAVQAKGWDCGASNGEGISRVIAETIHPIVLDAYQTASTWLDGNRANYIDVNNPTDQDSNSNGCSVLFINWMWKVKGLSFTQICHAGEATLAGTYKTLTGKTTAWVDFMADVNARWPAGQPSGVVKDQAW